MEEVVQAADQAAVPAPMDREVMDQALADFRDLVGGFNLNPSPTEEAALAEALPFLEVLEDQITSILEILAFLQKAMGEGQSQVLQQAVSQWVEVPAPPNPMEEAGLDIEVVWAGTLDQFLGELTQEHKTTDIEAAPTSPTTTTTLMDMGTDTIQLAPLGTGPSLPGIQPTTMETLMPLSTMGEGLA